MCPKIICEYLNTFIHCCSPLLSRWTTTWRISPVPRNGTQFSPFKSLAESHLENLSMKIPLSSLWFLLSRHVERMVRGERRWEERAWEWMWGSSREPPWVLPRPEVNKIGLSRKWTTWRTNFMLTECLLRPSHNATGVNKQYKCLLCKIKKTQQRKAREWGEFRNDV